MLNLSDELAATAWKIPLSLSNTSKFLVRLFQTTSELSTPAGETTAPNVKISPVYIVSGTSVTVIL